MKTVDQNVQSMKLFKFNMNSQNDYIIKVICKITYISIMHRFNSNKSETSGSVHWNETSSVTFQLESV